MTVLLLLSILVGGFLWRLKTAPIDLSFAKTYVEDALSDAEAGIRTSTGDLVLYMPDFGQPMLIGLTNVKLTNKDGEVILGIDEAAISLSISKLLIGAVSPRQLILKKPFLRVLRTEENGFQLGLGSAPPAAKQEGEQSDLMSQILQYVARPGDENNGSPLASLQAFEIEDARVLIEDHVLGVSWFLPQFDAALESTRDGLGAALQLGLPEIDGQPSFIRTSLTYDWDTKLIALKGDVHNVDMYSVAGKIPGLTDLQNQDVILNGTLSAILDETFMPKSAQLALASMNGSLVIPGVYNEPVSFDSILFKADYKSDDAQDVLNITQAQVIAQEVTIDAQGALTKKENVIDGPMSISIAEVTQEKIDALWPDALRGDPSEEWIVKNITGGTYRNVNAAMNLHMLQAIDGSWDVDAQKAKAVFAFEGMKVNYRPPMLPVTEAKGDGSFDYDTELLSVNVEAGKIGALALSEGKVELKNIIAVGKGVATIKAKVSGPGKDLLHYAEKDPINLGDKIDFNIDEVKGTGDLDVELSFPTIENVQMSDVRLDITGKLRDVYVPNILKTLPLTEGPLDLKITHEQARITGKAKIDGVPVDVDWMEYLESKDKPYAGQIKASLVADAALRAKLGIQLEAFLEGPVPVDVTYTTYADGSAIADVSANLATARFFAEPFNYEKPIGAPGTATMKAIFKNDLLTDVKDLNAKMQDFQLDNSLLRFKGANAELSAGTFQRLTVGETIGAVAFEIEPTGRLKISLNGPFLDLRPFLAKEAKPEPKPDDMPMAISVAVDRMRTADTEIIQKAKMYIDIDKQGHFNQLEMDATAGKGDIYLRFKPEASGKRTFRMEAGDAGATLKAFDVYDKIVGGKMTIYAEPIDNVYDRNLVGSAEITNFSVVKAPSLARLLSVMSLTGVLDVLNDDGLTFTKLEANFDWLYRPQGSILVLKDGRTSGNSLGLTFDGKFDNSNGSLDVKGTIIPLSGINEIIGSIPLVGDILTGGTGSLFAATYSAKSAGKGQEAEISVNPLSVLTPGILRRILFE